MIIESIKDLLNYRSIKKNKSRIGRGLAEKYTRYLSECRANYKCNFDKDDSIDEAVLDFIERGCTTIQSDKSSEIADVIFNRIKEMNINSGAGKWIESTSEYDSGNTNYSGDLWLDFPEIEYLFKEILGGFLIRYFKSDFKIFYGTLYSSKRIGERKGSQLWHSDGGPGICVNVIYYLEDTNENSGILEVLPWQESLEIYKGERKWLRERIGKRELKLMPKEELRKYISEYYDLKICSKYKNKIQSSYGKKGLIIPFLNNNIHRGGYPAEGIKRHAIVFHCYPSHKPIDYEFYKTNGINKTTPYLEL